MPILFQYRNIRDLLGMYITKHNILNCLKKSYAGAPHPQLPKLAAGALSYLSGMTNFDSGLGELFGNGLKKTTGV